MKTSITEMFGIEHPIIQGGMHFVGFAEMAAAVSNAGGLGIITGLTQRNAREPRQGDPALPGDDQQAVRREPHFPARGHAAGLSGLSCARSSRAASRSSRRPATIRSKWLPALKEAGIKVIHKCTSVRHSLKAESIGCDAVSVDGFECGGHPGEDDVPNFILLPRAAEELKIPFVASGGMADGRSLVAALALGADGMNMGTRFMATKEAPIHDHVKQALVAASELDTRLVMRPLRNTERVLKNAAVERLLERRRRWARRSSSRTSCPRSAASIRDHEGRRDGRRRLVVRHGGGPDPRRADRARS